MLYSIIVAVSLGLLSIFPPYVGFLYSGKIIKEFKARGVLKGSIIFLISGAFVAFIFNIFPIIYMFFGVYGVIILFYFLFEKTKLHNWDKAFIMTVISMVIIIAIYYTNKTFFINLKDSTIKEVIATMTKIDGNITKDSIMLAINDTLNSMASYFAIFIFLSAILTYVVVNRESWEKWEFSYIYLVGYIISFLLSKYWKTDDLILKNLVNSFKYFYIIYGIKEFYVRVKSRSKLKFFSIGLTLLLYSIEPFILFVYGAIKSFKLRNEEEKNV